MRHSAEMRSPHDDAVGVDLMSDFVKANVAVGTAVRTDGWRGYAALSGMGYRHRPRTVGDRRRGSKILPRVHRVFGNLQT